MAEPSASQGGGTQYEQMVVLGPALVNGCMIMLGALGAVTATAPAEWLLDCTGWRGLFELLAAARAKTVQQDPEVPAVPVAPRTTKQPLR